MNHFNNKRRNITSGPHLLGRLLMLAGLFALVSPMFLEVGSSTEKILFVGIGAILMGLLIVSSFGGTLIDFTGKRFKDYFSIAGYKFGEWEDLPDVSKVKVISTSYMSSNMPNGVSPTLSGKVTDFKTLVYSNESKPFLSFQYTNKDKAVNHGKLLASNLNAALDLAVPDSK